MTEPKLQLVSNWQATLAVLKFGAG